MIITPGMAVLLLAGYGFYKLWKKQTICGEDFILFVFLCVVCSILLIVGSLHGLTHNMPEKLKPVLKNVIESKSEESIISSLEKLNHESNIFNTMLEKRQEDSWIIRFIAWPVHRPWSHVVGSDNVEKYKAQWKLDETHYQATVVFREEKQ
ncbi:MAG: hypothetical protein AB8B73_14650 [Ekhidna sp.]